MRKRQVSKSAHRLTDFGSVTDRQKADASPSAARQKRGESQRMPPADWPGQIVGQDRASARELRTGRTQDFGSWTATGGTEASAKDPVAGRYRSFGFRRRRE